MMLCGGASAPQATATFLSQPEPNLKPETLDPDPHSQASTHRFTGSPRRPATASGWWRTSSPVAGSLPPLRNVSRSTASRASACVTE